jgi:ubiquinone/menaquinone biosynthesis C-methylase UbiE
LTKGFSDMVVAGDFTNLAEQYGKFRVGYNEDILSAILGMISLNSCDMDVVDIGAGTGIWTRMMSARGVHCRAVEPNAAMRETGRSSNGDLPIEWLEGSAECIPIDSGTCDWVTMASSFHWADFETAISEFHRVLRPGGWFTCLWNPRAVEMHPITHEIERKIEQIIPELNRKSSGRSSFTSELSTRLPSTGQFQSPIYMEGQFTVEMPRQRYLGVWDSVNDIRAQAGESRWEEIRSYIHQRTIGLEMIPCVYWTRAWSCQRIG